MSKNNKIGFFLLLLIAFSTVFVACSTETEYSISDFYNPKPNSFRTFEGAMTSKSTGNEIEIVTEFFQDYIKDNKSQERAITSLNGNTVYSADIFEFSDGQLKNIASIQNFRDHSNLLEKEPMFDMVILKEPLKKGESWIRSQGENYKAVAKIVAMEQEVTVPYGTFKAMVLEISDELTGEKTLEYYVKDIGLVKLEYESTTITQYTELTSIEENTLNEIVLIFTGQQEVVYFEGEADEYTAMEPAYEMGIVNYPTNGKLEEIYTGLAREFLDHKFGYELDDAAKINKLTFNRENETLKVDVSSELAKEFENAGELEMNYIRCFVDTIGYIFMAFDVNITVDGEAYTSENISLGIDEYIRLSFYEDLTGGQN